MEKVFKFKVGDLVCYTAYITRGIVVEKMSFPEKIIKDHFLYEKNWYKVFWFTQQSCLDVPERKLKEI